MRLLLELMCASFFCLGTPGALLFELLEYLVLLLLLLSDFTSVRFVSCSRRRACERSGGRGRTVIV